MAKAENQLYGESSQWHMPSPEAARLLQVFLGDKLSELQAVEGFDTVSSESGLQHFFAQPAAADNGYGTAQLLPQAFVMHRDPATHHVVSAMLQTKLPNRLYSTQVAPRTPLADHWYGQIHFPDAASPLAVVRTWHRPDTELAAEAVQAYDAAYGELFSRTDLVDFPEGANRQQETVYGASQDLLSTDHRARLYYLSVQIGKATNMRLAATSAQAEMAELAVPELVHSAA